MHFLGWKQDFYIGNRIFGLKKRILDWKQDFYNRNAIFRLETRFLNQKRNFQIGNAIFRLETGYLDWKQDFQIGNEIFRLDTGFLDQKQDFRLETGFLIQKPFLSKNISLAHLGHHTATINIACDSTLKKIIFLWNLFKPVTYFAS